MASPPLSPFVGRKVPKQVPASLLLITALPPSPPPPAIVPLLIIVIAAGKVIVVNIKASPPAVLAEMVTPALMFTTYLGEGLFCTN